MAKLIRESDGKENIGSEVKAIAWNEDKTFKEIIDQKPIIGCSLIITNGISQKYWLTTIVTEILEEKENYIKFRTENSIRILRKNKSRS